MMGKNKVREFLQASPARIAEALWRTCLAGVEETDAGGEAFGPGLRRILRKNSKEPVGGAPPGPSWGIPAGFSPPPGSKNSSDRESDSARGQSLPGPTTEVSSPQTGLVSPKAGAIERREALEKFSFSLSGRVGIVNLLFILAFPSLLYAQATVKGRVIFEGTPPAAEKVEVKSDIPTCGTTKEVQRIVLGKDQEVVNAVVKIIGAKGTLEVKKGTLDQINCEFAPHVQALPVGSTLILTSSDPVLHNSHGFYEDGSTAFNIAVPIMGMEVNQKLSRPGLIKLRCDAGHTWMSAYVVVTDEPFYAVTDADGNFQIDGIPAGSYEIEVWQEWLGTHREPIDIKEEREPLILTLRKS